MVIQPSLVSLISRLFPLGLLSHPSSHDAKTGDEYRSPPGDERYFCVCTTIDSQMRRALATKELAHTTANSHILVLDYGVFWFVVMTGPDLHLCVLISPRQGMHPQSGCIVIPNLVVKLTVEH